MMKWWQNFDFIFKIFCISWLSHWNFFNSKFFVCYIVLCKINSSICTLTKCNTLTWFIPNKFNLRYKLNIWFMFRKKIILFTWKSNLTGELVGSIRYFDIFSLNLFRKFCEIHLCDLFGIKRLTLHVVLLRRNIVVIQQMRKFQNFHRHIKKLNAYLV